MAIKQEIWDKARILYEHGNALNDIAKELGINKGSISRKSKQEEWVKNSDLATLVNDEVEYIIKGNEIATQKATLATQELRLHDKAVQDKIRRQNLVYGNAEKFIGQLSKISDSVDNGMEMKAIVEANHKAGQTLGVVEQFAPKTDINNNNNQQNNVVIEIE
jgi:molybdopterin/thiamine biosynthesis adenylyltransferase